MTRIRREMVQSFFLFLGGGGHLDVRTTHKTHGHRPLRRKTAGGGERPVQPPRPEDRWDACGPARADGGTRRDWKEMYPMARNDPNAKNIEGCTYVQIKRCREKFSMQERFTPCLPAPPDSSAGSKLGWTRVEPWFFYVQCWIFLWKEQVKLGRFSGSFPPLTLHTEALCE